MMTDYIVVQEWLLNRFTDLVNQKIKEGYITVGGVSRATDGANHLYIQAMAKLNNGLGI
jgi:hypothetical protein